MDLKGHTVTIDAMGCQKKIAQQIIDGGGAYVFNLKGNQSSLHEDIRLFVESYIDEKKLANTLFDKHEVIDGDHGRIEVRRYWITEDIAWLTQTKDWPGLKSVGMVEYENKDKRTGKLNVERRYFISSLSGQAKPFSQAIRMHWGIENGLHWCLDVAFNEDACRVRKDYAPENFAVIRHIALNLLKNEKTAKTGIKNKRLIAGWDHDYLAKLLNSSKST